MAVPSALYTVTEAGIYLSGFWMISDCVPLSHDIESKCGIPCELSSLLSFAVWSSVVVVHANVLVLGGTVICCFCGICIICCVLNLVLVQHCC